MKKTLLRTLVLLTLLTFGTRSSLAEPPVAYLLKDDPAPFAGFLFHPDKERELRLSVIELEGEKKKNVLQRDIINNYKLNEEFYTKRIDLYRTQNDDLAKTLESNKTGFFWEKTLYFITGALISGAIGFGVYTSATQK